MVKYSSSQTQVHRRVRHIAGASEIPSACARGPSGRYVLAFDPNAPYRRWGAHHACNWTRSVVQAIPSLGREATMWLPPPD